MSFVLHLDVAFRRTQMGMYHSEFSIPTVNHSDNLFYIGIIYIFKLKLLLSIQC